jgi:glucosylceramidase
LNVISTEIALVVFISSILTLFSCSKKTYSGNTIGDSTSTITSAISDVSFWLTEGDQPVLLQKQNVALIFGTNANAYQYIDVDSTQSFQTVDGFGFTLFVLPQLLNPVIRTACLIILCLSKDKNRIL